MPSHYNAVRQDDKVFLLSNSSSKIVKSLLAQRKRTLRYGELTRKTRVPLASLYVFVSRLRNSGLVKTEKEPNGTQILVSVQPGVESIKTKYVG